MDRRMADALDRHITGNYGEDFFADEPAPQDYTGPTCDCDEGRGPEGCEVHDPVTGLHVLPSVRATRLLLGGA